MGRKYVGLEVHQSSTLAAVHDERRKSVMESILATEAETIRDFLKGLRGKVHVTFEEGTLAACCTRLSSPWSQK
jgi:hypothetical protein